MSENNEAITASANQDEEHIKISRVERVTLLLVHSVALPVNQLRKLLPETEHMDIEALKQHVEENLDNIESKIGVIDFDGGDGEDFGPYDDGCADYTYSCNAPDSYDWGWDHNQNCEVIDIDERLKEVSNG